MRVQDTAYRFYTAPRDARALITLWDDGGELVVDKPTSDPVHGGNHVIWFVDNQSARPHRVEVTNFRPKGGGAAEWPFENSPPAVVDVPAGEIGRITLRTLDYGPHGKKGTWPYSYGIVVDGTALEPELVVEWPV